MIDIEAERAKFEAWCVERWCGDRGSLNRFPPDHPKYAGNYENGAVEFAWQSRLETLRSMTTECADAKIAGTAESTVKQATDAQ